MASVEVVENDADRDEIEMHISGHYFTACKAVWHILGFPLVTTEDCLNNHTGLYQCPHNWKVTWHTCFIEYKGTSLPFNASTNNRLVSVSVLDC